MIITVFRGLCMMAFLATLAACTGENAQQPVELALSDTPLPGKIIWRDLITDDVATAKAFYAGLLGWTYENGRTPRGDAAYTLIHAGDRIIGGILYLKDPPDAEYSRWLPYMSVRDVPAALVSATEQGGAVVAPTQALGSFGEAAVITDAEGAVMGLIRSRLGDPLDQPLVDGGFAWTELLAQNPGRAAAFYSRVSGSSVVSQSRRGGQYLMLKAQAINRAGILQHPGSDEHAQWLTHISVDDLDGTVARVVALGGEVLLSPDAAFREASFAVIADPAGAQVALTQREVLQREIR